MLPEVDFVGRTSCAIVLGKEYVSQCKAQVLAKCACDHDVVILCGHKSGRRWMLMSAHLPTHGSIPRMYGEAWLQLADCCRRLTKNARRSYQLELYGWADANLELRHVHTDSGLVGELVSQPLKFSSTMQADDQLRYCEVEKCCVEFGVMLASTFSERSKIWRTQTQNNGRRQRCIDYSLCRAFDDEQRRVVRLDQSFWMAEHISFTSSSVHDPLMMKSVWQSANAVMDRQSKVEHKRQVVFKQRVTPKGWEPSDGSALLMKCQALILLKRNELMLNVNEALPPLYITEALTEAAEMDLKCAGSSNKQWRSSVSQACQHFIEECANAAGKELLIKTNRI